MRKQKIGKFFSICVLLLLMLAFLYPIILIVLNSFKPFAEMFQSFISFPKTFYLENYKVALESTDFVGQLINNFILTAMTVVGILIATSLAGYKLSRVKTKLSRFFYLLFTVPFLIPFYTYMIPLVQTLKELHLMNSLFGLALVYVSTSSFSFFMFHGFSKGIPIELDEAARIDGCSEFGIFFRVILPLLKPVISSVAVLYSIWTWNDFLLPFLTLTSSEKHTITISVYQMFGRFGSDWDIVTATLVLATLPIIILYIALQKYIVEGVVAGAVKG